ncbi:uncharacterized protein GIQ15_06267 [Arthroderma uncinatum]|uniref:uncharacterized protein n=1 Tax=Arthroderma uncinatum TaxID=74035 RepID=UPI00144AABCA|nr:uncharacterized protein GIQ15_06267 [Arthroderma uncinatum]KAF3480920.1 hypothetical protein GIQ15_06267 [Arthroderma uncinatum]
MSSQPPMDVRSVGSCVAAVVAAYHDAAKLVKRIQSTTAVSTTSSTSSTTATATATGDASNTALVDLGDSLMLGPPIVQGQYEENLMRLGNAYANGDQNARETLKDVVINLQLTLLGTLRMALLDNLELDFDVLQRASDESRVNALICLFQLGQRLSLGSPTTHPKIPSVASSAPPSSPLPSLPDASSNSQAVEPVPSPDLKKPPPLLPVSPPRRPPKSISSTDQGSRASRDSSYMHQPPPSSINPVSPPLKPQPNNNSNLKAPPHNHNPNHGLRTPPARLAELQGSQPMIREESNKSPSIYSVLSSNNSSTKGVEYPDRSKFSQTSDPHIEPDQSAVELSAGRFSRTSSSRSSSNDPRRIPHPGTERHMSLSSSSQGGGGGGGGSKSLFKWKSFTRSSASKSAIEQANPPPPDLYLPTEENNYAGFCKGAWRLQYSMKNSFRIDNRPVGMYMLISSWHCSKCSFEGIVQESKFSGKAPVLPAMLGPVKTSIIQGMRVLQMFDQTVHFHGPSGNRYRWIFLAKSHVECKPSKPTEKPVHGYGCIFCSSQNQGPAPIYGNLDTFMEHLREHGGRGYAWDRKKPSQPLLDWTRCILGRIADDSEDFDINIPTVAEVGG